MKRIILVVLASVMLSACGDESPLTPTSGVVIPPIQVDSRPTISNLRFAPQSATLNQGGGAVTVVGSYDFIDAGGDLAGGTVTLTVLDSNNNVLDSTTTALTNITGVTSGILSGPATVPTTAARTLHFTIFITDSKGNKSNTLSGSFTVL